MIHELVHFQQNYAQDNTPLAQCIKEGAADFICELVTGSHSTKRSIPLAIATTKNSGLNFSKTWTVTIGRPGCIDPKTRAAHKTWGYWMGYQIVKAFYERMEDKETAIFELLNIRDFKAFLLKSGYQGA